jgi:Xaa-Pro aminopeptidase
LKNDASAAANPFAERLEDLAGAVRRRRLDALLVFGEANIRSLTGMTCDNGCLVVCPRSGAAPAFVTDFRYVPMAHRVAPWLRTVEQERGRGLADTAAGMLKRAGARAARVGYERSISAGRYLQLQKLFRGAKLVEAEDEVLNLRAVKTVDEITRIAAAEALNDAIWRDAQRDFRSGMTEKEMQRIIRAHMNARGDGEAFETIVCAGANAAECHHVPDDTVWRRGEPLLVGMGVKLDGVCSDMTRCIRPSRSYSVSAEYEKVYSLVLEANLAAIAAARPGMTGKELDKIARDIICKAGYGPAFGHSLGHGVGYEIHEMPSASTRSENVLKPGMLVTIEPGVYLEGRLGVRIEDLVLITTTGCEVLSHSRK